MPTQTKKPRTRAYGPKVRTGCLTCKTRRKKCDEEKPTCRRCREGDYTCDGYPSTTFVSQKINKKSGTQAHGPPARDMALARYLPPGNAVEQHYLHHFFQWTVKDLIEVPDAALFWNDTLVTLSHQQGFIQPAVTALGAAHWLYISDIDKNAQIQNFVVDRYNEAIRHLVPAMAPGSDTDIKSILTCCLIFFLLETMRGNQITALQHLESGSQLIINHRLGPTNSDPSLQWLIDTFHSLGGASTLFSEDRVFPDLTPYRTIRKLSTEPFTDLQQASDELEEIDNIFSWICWDVPAYCDDSECCNCPKGCDCEGCREWDIMEHKMELFARRFDPMAEQLAAQGDPALKLRLLRCQIVKKTLQWCFRDCEDESHSADMHQAIADDLLNDTEEALKMGEKRPAFCVSADIIPTIIDVYQYCPDVKTRLRAIGLLRAYRRREVTFDNIQVANYLEDHFSKLNLNERSNMKEADLSIGPSIKQSMFQFVPRGALSQK